MSKMLAIVAAAGLALCVVFLGGAWALGGDNVFHDPRSLEGLKPLIDLATHKEWRWAGGDTLALDAPMTIRYQPQGKPSVTITGPADAMDHVHVAEGRITSDAPPPSPHERPKLQAVVAGVPIRKFVVNDGQNLQLGHIDQDELTIHINGAGKVSGDGKVQRLMLVMNGASSADLGGLEVGDASISVLGSGDATFSPHGDVKLYMAGNGRIRMLTRPASIQRRILGNPIIETPDGTEAMPPPTPPRPPTPETPPMPPVPPVPATPMQMQMQMQVPVIAPVPRHGRIPDIATGPNGEVIVSGREGANLGHIDQDRLVLLQTSSGPVRAEGHVDTLEVRIAGHGTAHLEALSARHAVVSIMGSGNVFVAPSDDISVTIMGSGNVHLVTRPERIERHITGSGRIVELP